MSRPSAGWLEALPADRLLVEVSLWSADLTRIAEEMARVEPIADLFHIDVADGHFAPALLFFPDLVANVRDATTLPLHVHLMVDDSILIEQITQFAEAGADVISIHAENSAAAAALDHIDSLGVLPGMVVRVDTPVATVDRHLHRLRFITLLGTAIGIKGADLDPDAPARLREARALIAAADPPHRTLLAADGAIRTHTVPLLHSSGAQTIVAGSLAFKDPGTGYSIHSIPFPNTPTP